MGLYSSICCDSCDKALPFFYTTPDKMIKVANDLGWKIEDDGEAICDKCYQKVKENNEHEP